MDCTKQHVESIVDIILLWNSDLFGTRLDVINITVRAGTYPFFNWKEAGLVTRKSRTPSRNSWIFNHWFRVMRHLDAPVGQSKKRKAGSCFFVLCSISEIPPIRNQNRKVRLYQNPSARNDPVQSVLHSKFFNFPIYFDEATPSSLEILCWQKIEKHLRQKP